MTNKYKISELAKLETLPQSLKEAVERAEKSEFLADRLPEHMLERFIAIEKELIIEYERAADKEQFETARYFYHL